MGGVNPYVFVVGCPRSGTTLLQRMLDAHPGLAMINQTRWIADWYERRTGLTADGQVTPELLDRLYQNRHYTKLGIERRALEERLGLPSAKVPYARFVSAVFDLYGEAQGIGPVGEKAPRYVSKLPVLDGLFPETRFVHIIRDGRDVALSVAAWKKGAGVARRMSTYADQPIATIALWWEWRVRLGREAGIPLGPERYCEVRYESLVADPAGECEALCRFLELPYDDAMLRFHEGRTKEDPRLDAKKAWRPVTAGLRDWRTQMAREDVERFEAAAGGLLEELGYERFACRPGRAAASVAARVRDSFLRELGADGQPVPGAWAA
jgi:Sulfotransferase family